MGTVGAFDAAVEFRTTGRQDEEANVVVGAGGFKLRHEFTAAIDLDRLDRDRERLLQVRQKVARGGGGGTGADHRQVVAADDIVGGEVFEDRAGHRSQLHGVDLDQVARCASGVLPWLADGMRLGHTTGAPRDGTQGFDQVPGRLEIAQSPSHHSECQRRIWTNSATCSAGATRGSRTVAWFTLGTGFSGSLQTSKDHAGVDAAEAE
jgi:hypothetical protein